MAAHVPAKGRASAGRIWFWVASAVVFLVNAVLSVTDARWVVATLQAMTAVLAVLAAVQEWDAWRQPTGSPGSWDSVRR